MHLARAHGLFHRAPTVHVLTVRLMEKQQVDIVEPQARERLVDRLSALLVRIALREEFSGYKELLTRNAARGDHLTHGTLVEIHVGGIDMAVPGLDGARQTRAHLIGGHLKHTIAELRNLIAIVHRDAVHRTPFHLVRQNCHKGTTPLWRQCRRVFYSFKFACRHIESTMPIARYHMHETHE